MRFAGSERNQSRPDVATLRIGVTPCTDQILELRKNGYSTRTYDVPNIAVVADEFDNRSQHVGIWLGSAVIATGRMTPGPQSVFETWSRGEADIPTGPNVVDISRITVRPDMRRLGLSAFVLLECLRRSMDGRFEFVVGATVPHGPIFNLLRRAGFADAGKVVELCESQGQRVEVQPMVAVPCPALANLWSDMQEEVQSRLALNNFLVSRESA